MGKFSTRLALDTVFACFAENNNTTYKIMSGKAVVKLSDGEVHTDVGFDYLPLYLRVRQEKQLYSKEKKELKSSEKDSMKSINALRIYIKDRKTRRVEKNYEHSKEQIKLDTNVFEAYLE